MNANFSILTFCTIFLSILQSCKSDPKSVNIPLDQIPSCVSCNDAISRQNASIVFFDKESFCLSESQNLLNPPLPLTYGSETDTTGDNQNLRGVNYVSIDTFSNTCGQPLNDNLTLAGYYIVPSENINSGLNLKLNFYPVWIKHDTSEMIEITGEKIEIIPEFIATTSNKTFGGPEKNIPLLAPTAINSPDGFQHSVFQFHPVAVKMNFMKAYISRYELKIIIENSSYLGITGALVSSGNITTTEWGTQNEGVLVQTKNRSFFTYRFIGFNDYLEIDTTRNSSEKLLRLGSDTNNGGYSGAIPMETYAVPCPPNWNPNGDDEEEDD